jgi:uncharacterized protein (DUF305 family)
MKLPILRFVAVLAFAVPGVGLAQGKSQADGAGELHSIMMSSAKESQSMKMSGDVDHDFLTMMRHHHQSGIKMAEVQLQHGKDAKAREIARKIIDEQKKEIAEIDKALQSHGGAATGSSPK